MGLYGFSWGFTVLGPFMRCLVSTMPMLLGQMMNAKTAVRVEVLRRMARINGGFLSTWKFENNVHAQGLFSIGQMAIRISEPL